ncbi:hypothetical protein BG53_02900 [Paenibacillus darwinianus]|uniref:Uncharacterized protein n=1 Tax=Paenibacillus darwinianus TaxID=1380763 RepID=A0A9W5S2Y8_9BACL|nr:hypothetical protein [Paenibacillus darwinianus]EXX91327.1 hypothetical protein BG52_10870 [Paenibacillus darwinianus]EXX92169.1 hypothetical protein BG53_02900 [Paenibacillus darwinianus]EXX92505.1 hypothetical protein CH50_10975 [Paenibacillus darwinianus]
MKAIKAFAAAGTAAIIAGFAVLLLPHGGALPYPADEVAVFRPDRFTKLSDDNLVDALIVQSFSQPIKRTFIKRAVLSVDFAVMPETAEIEALLGDLKKLVKLSFFQTGNVDRLLVRFVEASKDRARTDGRKGYELLLAADIRRSDGWFSAGAGSFEQADLLGDIAWRQRLRLSYTAGWTERFGPPGAEYGD